MSKITIFGSSGFVGRNLVTYFNQKGIQVESLSLRKEAWVKSYNPTSKIIINLIGKAHDHKGIATESDYYFANVQLTKDIFQVFADSTANLLIHISSLAAVEEIQASKPLCETDVCNPLSWYGQTKRTAEEWLLQQKLPEGKKLIILRPPMIHGPGDKGNLTLLYKLISKGIPYPLSSFDNKRSFISIDNFIFFINEIIEKQMQLTSGIYHIADDQPVSTKEIIDIIKNISGRQTLNLPVPKWMIKTIAKVGDFIPIPLNSKRLKKMTSNLLVSNEKIKKKLGVDSLLLTAHEGIWKTIESFQNDKPSA